MSSLRETLQANLHAVHTRITQAARGAGRDPASIHLLAVSKSFDAETVAAAAECGQLAFGENYLQEAVSKMTQVRGRGAWPLQWHFIGPIQSNKTRDIAANFDWIQSVDRIRIAERLSAQRDTARGPLNVLLQVNISDEASKGGVKVKDLPGLARAVADVDLARFARGQPSRPPSLDGSAPIGLLATVSGCRLVPMSEIYPG
jgi:hypothetical protein